MYKGSAVVLIAIYIMLFFVLKPVEHLFAEATGMVDRVVTIIGIVTLVGLVASCLGMIFDGKVARKWLLAFNVPYLALGCFAVYFQWTFWLLESPTLRHRIRGVFPIFLLGVALPLFIFYYFRKPNGNSGRGAD